jgi:hypothetical protein
LQSTRATGIRLCACLRYLERQHLGPRLELPLQLNAGVRAQPDRSLQIYSLPRCCYLLLLLAVALAGCRAARPGPASPASGAEPSPDTRRAGDTLRYVGLAPSAQGPRGPLEVFAAYYGVKWSACQPSPLRVLDPTDSTPAQYLLAPQRLGDFRACGVDLPPDSAADPAATIYERHLAGPTTRMIWLDSAQSAEYRHVVLASEGGDAAHAYNVVAFAHSLGRWFGPPTRCGARHWWRIRERHLVLEDLPASAADEPRRLRYAVLTLLPAGTATRWRGCPRSAGP